MGDSTYSLAAVLEFNDRARLIEYLRHPLHEALGREFWEVSRSTVVVEVESRLASEWRVDELV